MITLEFFVSVTVGICAVLYFVTAGGYAYRGHWGWTMVYLSYALANVGLILTGIEALKKV